MPAWLQHDWCSSFVLVLGHFLWQGTLIAIVLAIALRATKKVVVRYWVSLAALLVMAVCPVVTLGWLMQPASHVAVLDQPPVVREEPTTSPPITPTIPFEESSDVGHASSLPVSPPVLSSEVTPAAPIPPSIPNDDPSGWQRFAPLVTSLYLSGVALMLMRLALGLWGGRQLRRRATPVTEAFLLTALQRQAQALGLKLRPALAYCERVAVPTVIGILKPTILLPLVLTSGLAPEQVEAVLAHELAHLRRCDHLVNLLQRVIESLLFFHPAVWWLSNKIRVEREHCCDDLVVACGAVPLDYAKSLLRVAELSRGAKLHRSVAAVSLLATGQPSTLRQRIARLLGYSAAPQVRLVHSLLVFCLGAVCCLLAWVVTTIGWQLAAEATADLNPPLDLANPALSADEAAAEKSSWDALVAMKVKVNGEAGNRLHLLSHLRHLEQGKFPEEGLRELRQQIQQPIREASLWNVPAEAWPHVGRLLSLRELSFVASDLRGKPMEQIGRLHHLQSLIVTNSKFQPQDLALLRQLAELEHLKVMFSVFDETVAWRKEQVGTLSEPEQELVDRVTAAHPDREHILQAAILTDRVLERLTDLKRLRSVKLINTFVSSRGIRALSMLPALEELELGVVDESPEVVRMVGGMRSLKRLEGLSLTDETLAEWTALTQLEELGRYAAGVTDRGVEDLLKFARLRQIVLWNCQITDAGLERLAELPNLEVLDVRFSKSLSKSGVERFQQRKPTCTVAFDPPREIATESIPAEKPQHFSATLPDGRSVELVGITKNTAPAKEGWKPNGLPIGDVGHWTATTYRSGNTTGSFVENGDHPEPNAGAIDLLFRFRGLKAQPSLTFELAADGVGYSHLPVKDPYELRVTTERRGPRPPNAEWSIPDGEMQVGLTDEPWGKWLQISPTGEVLNPLTDDDLHRSHYDQIQIIGVEPHERAPNKLALVLRQPGNSRQPSNISSLFAFEVRGIDSEEKSQWVVEWKNQGVEGTNLREGHWGLATTETKPLARFEYRLRPYRHWVKFTGVSLEPGRQSDVKVDARTVPVVARAELAPIIIAKILKVDDNRLTVWISVGKDDGVKPRMTFEVREPKSNEKAPNDRRVKGTIEVVRILSSDLAEARIVAAELNNGPAKGDEAILLGGQIADAGTPQLQWGETTNGLRARVVPVLSSMTEDAINLDKRVTKFAMADDVAFIFELENVSDKPIKLVDLFHNATNGESSASSDWLSQFMFSVDLFDRDGKRIEQPEIEVDDIIFFLHEARVVTLQPGKTQQFLIKPNRWLAGFQPRIRAGDYRVAVRYHWLSTPDAARTIRKNSPLLEAAAVNVASAAVAIEVGGESRPPDLVWGEAVNGLRAAVSFEPSKATYSHGEMPGLRLHLQNVGPQPLKLISDLSMPVVGATVTNEKGKPVNLDDSLAGGRMGTGLKGLLTLKPQQVVALNAGGLGLAISKDRAKQFDELTLRRLIAPAGKYSLQLESTFNTNVLNARWVRGQENTVVKDAWVGKLKTGAAPLTIEDAPAAKAAIDTSQNDPLKRPVSLVADNVPLKTVLEKLAGDAGLQMEFDVAALKDVELDLEQPVSAKFENVPLRQALGRVIDWQAHLGVMREVRGNKLVLTTLEAWQRRIAERLPEWMKPLYNNGLLATLDDDNEVVTVTTGRIMTDDLIARLAALPRLKELHIEVTKGITPAGFAHLARMQRLENFSLYSVNEDGDLLGDDAMRVVSTLPEMRVLSITECGLTDVGAALLERMPQLTSLRLGDGRLTDAALKSVGTLRKLKKLELVSYGGSVRNGRMSFSADGIRQLAGLENLESLSLIGHDVPADGLPFPKLTSLSLGNASVDDKVAKQISELRDLTSIELSYCGITDAGLGRIAALPKLERLDVSSSLITDAGIERFRSHEKLEHISLRATGLTDQSLESIAQIKTLTRLDLNGSGQPGVVPGRNFSMTGLQHLKRLPHLETLWMDNFELQGGYAGLKELSQLRELTMSMCNITNSELESLEEALPNTRISHVTGGDFTPKKLRKSLKTSAITRDTEKMIAKAEQPNARQQVPPIDPVKELASFQGTWCFDVLQFRVWPEPIGVGTDSDGRKSEKRMVVKGNHITWTDRRGEQIVVEFKIDPFQTPKQIDFTFLMGPNRGAKSLGIYEPQMGNDDYLWLCMTNPGTNAPRPTDVSYSSLKPQSMIGMHQVAPPEKTSNAKALERFQGVWEMSLCDSTLTTFGASQKEIANWQWTIEGDEILWRRGTDEWKLKLEVDPSKRPREVNLTHLTGPYKGEKCLGMYEWDGVDGQSFMIAIQDPGSDAPRPTRFQMSGNVKTGLMILRPRNPTESERLIGAFQGTWTLRNFDTGKNNDKSSWPMPKGKGPDKSGAGSELRWIVKGNEITWTSSDGQTIKASFTFDPVKRPKQIDLTFLSGPNKGETCPGIYHRGDLDENILWLCLADPGSNAARPKSFSYQFGEGRSVLSLYLHEQPASPTAKSSTGLPPKATPSGAIETETVAGVPTNSTAAKRMGGHVKGTILVDGVVPAVLPAPGRQAGRAHSELLQREWMITVRERPTKMWDESLLVSKEQGLANAIVYLKSTPPGFQPEPPPDKPFVLTNEASRFSPRLAVMRAGQSLWLKNADSKFESFKSMPLRGTAFNMVVAAGTTTPLGERAFGASERFPVEVTSQLQFWKKAFVLPLDHPFAAVTDESGRFEITGLPPGQHDFIVWHERTGYLEKKLTVAVKTGETTNVPPLRYEVARFKPQEMATGVASRWVHGGEGWSVGIHWKSGRNEFVIGTPERTDAVTFQLSMRNDTDQPLTVPVPQSLTWDLEMMNRDLFNVRIHGAGQKALTLAAREVRTLDVPQPTLNLADIEPGHWQVRFTTPLTNTEPMLDLWLDSPSPPWLTQQVAKLSTVTDHPDDKFKHVRWGESLQGLRLGMRVASDPVDAVSETSVLVGTVTRRPRLTWLESQSVKLVPELFVWNTTETEVEIATSMQSPRDGLHRLIPDEGAHLRTRPSGPHQIGPDSKFKAGTFNQRHRLQAGAVLRLGETSLQIVPRDSKVPLDHQTARLPAHEYGYQMLVAVERTDQPDLRLHLPSGIQRPQTVLPHADLPAAER